MRIICTVAIGNRRLPTLAVKTNNKHVKSTLALCKHPKSEQEYLLILFTAQNRTGTKYKLSNNINGVLTKFINEGKATIQFKEPPHDLYIKAEQIQLKGFLMLMKRALENKLLAKELTLSSISVTAIPQKNIAPTKLVVTNRSELPKQGFPRTLEAVYINEIKLCKLSIGILQLQRLRILDVSDNLIEYLPSELKNLPIRELNVSKNQLCKSTSKRWGWIGGILLKTLQSINISSNDLSYLPKPFVKFYGLVNINISNNKLNILPAGLGNLQYLHTLNVANNNLTVLPGSMKQLKLEYLDISNNSFQLTNIAAVVPKVLPVCTLKESSARQVLHTKLLYTAKDIPITLVNYLDDAHYCCICAKACFEVHLCHVKVLILNAITNTRIATHSGNWRELDYVPAECYYCSLICFRQKCSTIFNM